MAARFVRSHLRLTWVLALTIAVPTLVRKLPEPVRRIIGDLSDTEKVLVGLQLLKDRTDP